MMTHLEFQYSQLIATFEAVVQMSPVKRVYFLSAMAPLFGITRSESRRLFEMWLVETLEGSDK